MASFESYTSWDEVLAAASRDGRLYYQAPLDAVAGRSPRMVLVDKVYKNGKLRIDPLSNQADKFTADAGHLLRFRRKVP